MLLLGLFAWPPAWPFHLAHLPGFFFQPPALAFSPGLTGSRRTLVAGEGEEARDGRAVRNRGAAVEVGELDDEVVIDGRGVEFPDEAVHGADGAAGREEVVMDQDHVARGDRVEVELDGVDAVFLGIGFGDGGRGELAGLAGEDEACAEAAGDRRAHDKAAGLNPDDLRDALVLVELVSHVDHRPERLRILEQRRHIIKQNPRLRIIRHGPDGLGQFF